MDQSIGLAEFIQNIKDELIQQHNAEKPLFIIGEIELEIGVTVERSANGGMDIKVVQFGMQGTATDIQTVRVKLHPLVTPDEIRKGISSQERKRVQKDVLRSE